MQNKSFNSSKQAAYSPSAEALNKRDSQPPLPIQKKLIIGAENDPLEAEADAVANKVIGMQNIAVQSSFGQNKAIQRRCNHCEQEENDGIVQKKPLVSFIQKKERYNTGNTATEVINNQIYATKGGGSRMDNQTQTFMESRFGTSFQDVRIHTGGYASELSQQLNAKAFTVGNDVYFNQNNYSPNTTEGKHLLAHELTHTVQQSSGIAKPNIQKKIMITGTTSADTKQKFLAKINEGSSVVFDMEASGNLKPHDAKAVGQDEYAKQLLGGIADGQTVNLNLINESATNFIDGFETGDVDSADMLKLSPPIFRSWLLHFVVERFATKEYEKYKGATVTPDFLKAHEAGHESQERYLKELYPTKTIKFKKEGIDESTRKVDKENNGTVNYNFDFTDITFVFVQPVVKGVLQENIIKAYIKEKNKPKKKPKP